MQSPRNYLLSWIFCAHITLALNSGLGLAFTSYSHSWSHRSVNKRYHTRDDCLRIIPITTVAVTMTKKAPIAEALKCNHGEIRRRKACVTLFMANENFTNKQLEVDVKINGRDKIEKETSTDTDNSRAYDENESDDPEFLLPGSKKLAAFFALPIVDVGQASLVLLSSLLLAVGTIQTLPEQVINGIFITEDLIGYAFFLDFLFRWYSKGFKKSYLLNPFSLIDAVFILPVILRGMPALAALLPGSVSSSSGLINLRLLRILRLQLVLSDLETFGKFELALGLKPSDIRPYQLQLARVILSIFTLISVSSGLIYTSEHTANPTAFPDYFTALYFGLTTLTTVGFGDIVPITFNGRLVVSGSILAGVAIIPIQTASFFEALLDFQKERDKSESRNDVAEKERIELEQNVINRPIPSLNDDNIISMSTTSTTNGNYYSPELFIDCLCKTCKADSHRRDAFFCWRCGAELTSSDGNVIVDTKPPSL